MPCAEKYAESIGHVLIGEHKVIANGCSSIEYHTEEPSESAEKSNH